MKLLSSLRLRAAMLSALMLLTIMALWHAGTAPRSTVSAPVAVPDA